MKNKKVPAKVAYMPFDQRVGQAGQGVLFAGRSGAACLSAGRGGTSIPGGYAPTSKKEYSGEFPPKCLQTGI